MNGEDIALQINNLSVCYEQEGSLTEVLNGVTFKIYEGEILSLVGESGSGKSTIAKAVGGLLPPSAYVKSGSMRLGTDTDISFNGSTPDWKAIRGKKLAFIFQDARLALNPIVKIKDQFKETLLFHRIVSSKKEVRKIGTRYLKMLNFENPEGILDSYPFQLSGGMCQRVCIALALCLSPSVLIADEPTSALDAISQREVLNLLEKVKNELGLSVLIITHDMSVARAISRRMIVLNRGTIVEEGETEKIFSNPKDAYTKQLISARGLFFKAAVKEEFCEDVILSACGLSKNFSRQEEVLKDISFDLHKAEIFGILGESGCGKSTLARCLIGLEQVDKGKLLFHGESIVKLEGKHRLEKCRRIQLIFQDARACLNPRRKALQIVREPLDYLNIGQKNERYSAARSYLDLVGITGDAQLRRPPQLSTGQCQRVAIARALAAEPEILICDEAVSSLDMTVQAQILELLMRLHDNFGFSIIMITHDIQILRHFCHKIAVMKDGIFSEITEAGDKLDESRDPYTQLLLKNEGYFGKNCYLHQINNSEVTK